MIRTAPAEWRKGLWKPQSKRAPLPAVAIWFGLSEMTDSDKPRTSARTRRTKAGHLINKGTDKTGQASDKTRTSRTHPPKGVSVSEVSKEPKREKPPGPADPGRLEGWPKGRENRPRRAELW